MTEPCEIQGLSEDSSDWQRYWSDRANGDWLQAYFIGMPGLNVIKIGQTTDVLRRLRNLKTQSPIPGLTLLASVAVAEKLIHRFFESKRSHGEWFWTCPPLREMIACCNTYGTLPQPQFWEAMFGDPTRYQCGDDYVVIEKRACTEIQPVAYLAA